MIRKSKIIIAVASVASFTGQAADPALIAKGKLLFVTKICSQCHQYDKNVPAPAGIALKVTSVLSKDASGLTIVTLEDDDEVT